MEQLSNFERVMDARDHFKNGASTKSLMSSINNIKKFVCFIIVGFVLSISVSAQSELTIKQNKIYQSGTGLTKKQVRDIMSENNEALKLYNCAQRHYTLGYGASGVGVATMVTQLFFSDNHSEVYADPIFIAGAGLGIVGVFVGLAGNKKLVNSVSLFNSKINNKTSYYKVDFGTTQTGIGFTMRF